MAETLTDLELQAARLRTEIKIADGWGEKTSKIDEYRILESRIYAAKLRLAQSDPGLIRPFEGSFPDLWRRIPSYMHEGLCNYLNFGMVSGDFLMSVFRNNLSEAVTRADTSNKWILLDYVHLLYAIAPVGSWGSDDQVRHWLRSGGIYGLRGSLANSSASASSPSSPSSSASPQEPSNE